ncbi:MAG: PilZ domain-containing protein [Fuerstiella sp.]|jgi:hypothetical protein
MALNTDSYIYLQQDISSTRTDLLPGRVLWTNGDLVAAEMNVVAFPNAGKKVVIHYEEGRRFVAQDAVVEGITECEPADDSSVEGLSHMDLDENSRPVNVVLARIGDPVLAESRECYRVQTVPLNVTVDFGTCRECELLDISQTGFAVLSDDFVELHSVVDVALLSGESGVKGQVRILSSRQLRDGRYRYGVAVLGHDLQNACKSLASELQRQVLRRSVAVRSS